MPRLICIISFLYFLGACSTSPKTHFYVLNTKFASKEVYSGESFENVGLGIWLVKLPRLLDRPQIMTRTDQFNIELSDFHKWVGGLGNNMTRLIANELGRLLQTDRVVISPWSSYVKNDYQLIIHVDRFDGELGNEVVLKGVWSLLNSKGNKELIRKAFTYTTKASGKSYGDMVAALSTLTMQLTQEIAKIIASRK